MRQPVAPPSPLADAIARLAAERPELGLGTEAGSKLPTMAEVVAPGSAILDRWLADTTTLAPGMDAKTAAAYLLSIFVWRFGQILGALYLSRTALPPLTSSDLAVEMEAHGEGRSRDVRFHYVLTATGSGHALDRTALAQSIVHLHVGLVEALHRTTGLSRRALWRLITDGMAEGLLDHGRRTSEEQFAEREAIVILADPPLHNRQWRFVEIGVPGKRRRWFRLRGGCCRLYLTPGTDYCTTCVVRSESEQVARLTAFVERRPS